MLLSVLQNWIDCPAINENKKCAVECQLTSTPLLLTDIVSRLSEGVTNIVSASQMFFGAGNNTQFTQTDWFDAASSNVKTTSDMFRGAVI